MSSSSTGTTKKINLKPELKVKSSFTKVYHQLNEIDINEKSMIEFITKRELVMDEITSLISLQERNGISEDDYIYKMFSSLNDLRTLTCSVLNSIDKCQNELTRVSRPVVMGVDYIIDRIINNNHFINKIPILKKFDMLLYSRNVLILPYKKINSVTEMIQVEENGYNEIKKFSNPSNLNDIARSYQALYNCLPENIFNKIAPLQKWIDSPWIISSKIEKRKKIQDRLLPELSPAVKFPAETNPLSASSPLFLQSSPVPFPSSPGLSNETKNYFPKEKLSGLSKETNISEIPRSSIVKSPILKAKAARTNGRPLQIALENQLKVKGISTNQLKDWYLLMNAKIDPDL